MVSVIRRLAGEVVRDSEHIHSYYAASAIGVRQFPPIEDSETCDVCVVGGGYTGTSTALELAEKATTLCCSKPTGSAGEPPVETGGRLARE